MVHFFPYTILPWWFRKQPEASTAITGRGLEIAGQWAKCLFCSQSRFLTMAFCGREMGFLTEKSCLASICPKS